VKILFLLPHPPFPADRGNKLHTLNLLRQVSRDHVCDIVGVNERGREDGWLNLERALPGVRVLATFDPLRGRELAYERARCLARWLPYSLAPYRNPAFAEYIRALPVASYDVACLDMFMMAQYQPLISNLPTVLIGTDAYSLAMLRSARAARDVTFKLRKLAAAALQVRFERRVYPSIDVVACVSDVDNAWLERMAPGTRTRLVENAVAADLLSRGPKRRSPGGGPLTVMVWALVSSPDIARGVEAFVRRAWPRVAVEHPEARLVIWGRAPRRSLRAAVEAVPNASIVEYVDDWEEHLERADVFVYPQRCGTGTQNKIQAAMALGIPTVISPEAVGGLGVADGRDALIAADEDGFAEACSRLLTDPDLCDRLGRQARARIEQHFVEDVVARRFVAVLEEAIASRGRRSRLGGVAA